MGGMTYRGEGGLRGGERAALERHTGGLHHPGERKQRERERETNSGSVVSWLTRVGRDA
jgi:hypothetical protein